MSVTHIFLRKGHMWQFLFVKKFAFATQQIILHGFASQDILFLKTKRHPHLQRKAFEMPFLPSHTDIQDCPITRKTNGIETLSSLIHSGESRRQCLPLGLESEENQKQLRGSSPVQAAERPQLCLNKRDNMGPLLCRLQEDTSSVSHKGNKTVLGFLRRKKNNSGMCTCSCKGVHIHVCKHVCAWGYIHMSVNMFMYGSAYICM